MSDDFESEDCCYSHNHAKVMMSLGTEINNLKKFQAYCRLTLVLENGYFRPDISVYPLRHFFHKLDADVMEDDPPLLAIEIVPRNKPLDDFIDRAENIYLKSGINSVWIVQPFFHLISVFTGEGVDHYYEGTIHDISGVSIDISKLFDDQYDQEKTPIRI